MFVFHQRPVELGCGFTGADWGGDAGGEIVGFVWRETPVELGVCGHGGHPVKHYAGNTSTHTSLDTHTHTDTGEHEYSTTPHTDSQGSLPARSQKSPHPHTHTQTQTDWRRSQQSAMLWKGRDWDCGCSHLSGEEGAKYLSITTGSAHFQVLFPCSGPT